MQLKLETSQQEIARELGYLKSLCRENHQVVALGCEGNSLSLSASDGRIFFSSQIDVSCSESGEALVRTDRLFDVIKLLPRGTVALERGESGALTVSSGEFRATLPGAATFSSSPTLSTPSELTLQAIELEALISKVKFILGYGKGQYAQGALFEIQSDGLRLVATDGHRLAIATTGPFKDTGTRTRLVVPASGAWKLGDVLADHRGDVRLEYGERHFAFTIGRRRLAGTLCPWAYPDYGRIMPKQEKSDAILLVSALKATVRRATLLSVDPEIVMEFGKGEVKVAADDGEGERASDTLEACIQGEQPFRLKLNPNYLMEAVAAAGTEKVRLRFFGEGSAVIVQPEGAVSPRSEFLIMPMRLGD